MNLFQQESRPLENSFPGELLRITIVFSQFCKESIVRNRHRTGLAGLVVLERNTAIRAVIIIIMEPFAAGSFLFRGTFDVVHRFMAVPAFGTKTDIQRD